MIVYLTFVKPVTGYRKPEMFYDYEFKEYTDYTRGCLVPKSPDEKKTRPFSEAHKNGLLNDWDVLIDGREYTVYKLNKDEVIKYILMDNI